jgi:uncharacterized repeat protein (TIGR03806 family)
MGRCLAGLLCLFLGGCGGGGSGGGGNIGVGGTVPNVIGQTQAAATTAITGAGLTVGAVTTASSATVPVGDVINQSPTGGTSVAAGSAVDLVVSSGPDNNPPFGLITRPPLANFTLPDQGGGGGSFSLDEPFPNLPNFDNPIFFAAMPAPETRLLVVEQTGHIRVFANNAAVSTTKDILNMSSLIICCGEQGLLGFAFDPNFNMPTNRFIYVNYTRAGDGATVIARFTWDSGSDSASLASRKEILVIPQPFSNHNGGMIAFGPDGFLYIATGDGGSGGDPQNNAQDITNNLLGKILRIDVNTAGAYVVPANNPFVGSSGASPEIWALGLRNPFRFSFDRQTGLLWAGDVGQNAIEEIDIITSGANYGWSRFEGTSLVNGGITLVGNGTHTPPVFQYNHNFGFAIIGGYVYRGTSMASLLGKYVYADYGSGTVWAMDTTGQNNVVLTNTSNPTSFGEDNNGELYIVTQSGGLFRLTDDSGGGTRGTLLSQTGLFTNLANLTPASGLIEYDLNLPFWSDGATKRRWVGIPQNAQVTFSPTGGWVFPNGTVIVKHFEMELTEGNPNSSRRLETRLLIRDATGAWLGFTYKWNAAETEANLLVSGQTENLTVNLSGGGSITWPYSYPSRTDCLQCHTSAASFALGLATRQLNRAFDYGSVTDNQLRSLNHISYFTTDIGAATQYGAYAAIDDTNASVASRARAYLAVNCAQCHRPGGPTPVALDLRFDTADGAMGAVNVAPTEGTLGLTNARIIAPGSKNTSVLWERMRRLDGTRMPKLASHRVDQEAVDLIGSWIDSM